MKMEIYTVYSVKKDLVVVVVVVSKPDKIVKDTFKSAWTK